MNDILAGTRWFRDHFQQNRERYEQLAAQGQAPQVLYIGCSDSRVAPELITGADLGDLFVVRNVGNLVPPFGTGETAVGAALEYALLHLHVPDLVLCGHTDCGALKALDVPPNWSEEPHLARWIENARPAQTKVEAAGLPTEERPLAVARENVLLQLEHLRSYDAVRDGERAGTLRVHGWLYHLENGTFEAYDEKAATWTKIK